MVMMSSDSYHVSTGFDSEYGDDDLVLVGDGDDDDDDETFGFIDYVILFFISFIR